ncbi:MAG TPA: hypothetical protein VF487_08855 [Chitinophagaceae bacterium]
MKLSWTNFKISIAGAKLIHLVQKDKIWDHGSMAEQAKTIFLMIQKAHSPLGIESLKRHCMTGYFDNVKATLDKEGIFIENPVVKEVAVLEVKPGKGERPDMFTALISGISINDKTFHGIKFSVEMCFAREGQWWMLTAIKRWSNHKTLIT